MSTDPLLPILQATARVVLSRPAFAHAGHDVERFAIEQRTMLIDALMRVGELRERVRDQLRIRRDQPDVQAMATLVLAADDQVVRAGLRLAEYLHREDRTQQVRLRRQQDKANELRGRLERANGRHEHALTSLRSITTALADAERRVEELDAQVSTLRRRLDDPHTAATGLLAALRQPDEGETPLAGQAASAAGITPEALVTAVEAIVAPPEEAEPSVELPTVPLTMPLVRERSLRVVPLGGDTEIGGSCVLVEAGDTRLLVDAGLRPGDPARPPREIEAALDEPIDAVVVTHAHTDHCGYVPALVGRFPGLRVLATGPTARLMPVMWADSTKLMIRRERTYRQWGADGAEALYGRAEVDAATRNCEEIPYGSPQRVGDLTVELFPAGHILGAAGVVLRAGDQRVVISGDISGFRQKTVDGYTIPPSAREPDLLVLESTCCAETHGPRDARVTDLVKAVGDVYEAGGRVLLPAFALGRAQEIALILQDRLPHVPVLLDGMAADVADAFERITADRAVPLRIFRGAVARAERPADFERFTSGVVITTSGMMTGGPAVQWAARILPEPNGALFLSGYQDEESGGARLLRLAEGSAGHLTLDDNGVERKVPLKARIEMMRLSAHADKRGLLDVADEVAAREVMLVHGFAARQREFARILAVRDHEPVACAPWGAGADPPPRL
ncbi:MBL fold metallo-hydrolase [Spongiactinospora sp. TRM90649]|uniref:MBL fold metallo-hydrolase n=1 Tax=Spongiactinospora sp. TRM90649 TaxID=3031114 RepID=UPI0023F742A1|nr:MBL fold metallo-hydrolase [Spongiactinospora sp. TRM90649]MDF5757189.1 MBL fold metallo-hydrolase [Spongiactinospora sp. TRM90649]